jgi:Smg protein
MFDVLVYLYENYGAFESCPDATALGRSLADAGFDDDEIREALSWLQGLAHLVQDNTVKPRESADGSLRVYTPAEIERIGAEATGFLIGLDNAGQLTSRQREIVVERALATRETPMSIGTMKIIVLMVLWSHSADVDYLLLEDLLDDGDTHAMH